MHQSLYHTWVVFFNDTVSLTVTNTLKCFFLDKPHKTMRNTSISNRALLKAGMPEYQNAGNWKLEYSNRKHKHKNGGPASIPDNLSSKRAWWPQLLLSLAAGSSRVLKWAQLVFHVGVTILPIAQYGPYYLTVFLGGHSDGGQISWADLLSLQ